MEILKIIGLILLSMSPLGEHKIAMPLAMTPEFDLEVWQAWLICTGANLVTPPIIWYFLNNINHKLIKYDTYRKHAFDLARYAKRKLGNNVDKYGFWGIMIFIMIPLPMTGSYTGILAAWIVGLHKKPAYLAGYFGIILSSIIVAIGLTGASQIFS